jgi:biopolymer transport protein ExbD
VCSKLPADIGLVFIYGAAPPHESRGFAMSMNDAAGRDMNCEINVTPLIDVLLVLLIIFMVIVPAVPRGDAAMVPQPLAGKRAQDAVVLEVLRGAIGDVHFRINQQAVSREDLPDRLARIYANRAQRVLFVKGDDQLKFTEIAEVIDISHAAGVDHVGLLTPKLAAAI